MAVQEQRSLADRVFALLGDLRSTDASGAIGPDTDLGSIGFDSLACAELSAVVERELGFDLVDGQLAGLRRASEVAALVERTAAIEGRVRDRYPAGMGQIGRAHV